jgi:Zn-finger nucleic acid-binding protein
VTVPTAETPQLDVCSNGHGLWLDAGEINFFVEDYQTLTAALAVTDLAPAAGASIASTLCPRCGARLESAKVPSASWMTCRSCHGWWLPHGSLARLNETYRGGGIPIRIDEATYYGRAAARAASTPRQPGMPPSGSKVSPDAVRLWFGIGLLGATFLLVGLLAFETIRTSAWSAQWIQSPDDGFLLLLLGLGAGLGLFAYGVVLSRRRDLIESIPTSAIRSLALGLVEISGTAEPEGSPLSAPFSQTPCVLYSYAVAEHRGTGQSSHWVTIAKGVSEQPFSVRDATGTVRVVPVGAELIVTADRTYRNDGMHSLPSEAQAGLTRLGIQTDGWLGQKTLRCTEAFIRHGESVYVLGTAQANPAMGDRLENAERLFIGSHPDESFIISDESERELLAGLRWKYLAMLYGGPAISVACLAVILTYYVALGR